MKLAHNDNYKVIFRNPKVEVCMWRLQAGTGFERVQILVPVPVPVTKTRQKPAVTRTRAEH